MSTESKMAATRDLRRFTEFGRKIIGVGRNFRFGSELLDLVFQLVLSLNWFYSRRSFQGARSRVGKPCTKNSLDLFETTIELSAARRQNQGKSYFNNIIHRKDPDVCRIIS